MNLDWWGIKAQGTQIGVKMWDNRDVDPTALILIVIALLLIVAITIACVVYFLPNIYQKFINKNRRPKLDDDDLTVAKMKVLSMLEEGKITPQESSELFGALNESIKTPPLQ